MGSEMCIRDSRQLADARGVQLVRLLCSRFGMAECTLRLHDVALARHVDLLSPLIPAATKLYLAHALRAGGARASAPAPADVDTRMLLDLPPAATCMAVGSLPVMVTVPAPAEPTADAPARDVNLGLSVGWPANMLVDDGALVRYSRVTALLLRLQCARHALAAPGAFAGTADARVRIPLDLPERAVQLLRWRLAHALAALHAHLATTIVGTLHDRFEADIAEASSLDQLLGAARNA